ncbi:MAG TPA: hypothetical protein VGK34_10780 [Armatimonadota bacterium]
MNCSETRDILNAVIDDGSHARASEALAHAENCDSCREWYAETQAMLSAFDAAFENVPVPDIASVMPKLPERKSASARRRVLPGNLLVAIAASWLGGAAVIAAAAFLIYHSLGIEQIIHLASKLRLFTHEVFSFEMMTSIVAGMTKVLGLIVLCIKAIFSHYGPSLIQLLILDSLILLAAGEVWRRRSRLHRQTFSAIF